MPQVLLMRVYVPHQLSEGHLEEEEEGEEGECWNPSCVVKRDKPGQSSLLDAEIVSFSGGSC